MLNERFGISRMSEGNENAIWQCPEMYTCQAECMIEDNRNPGTQEEFTVFYTVEDPTDDRRELIRILHLLGYELCSVRNIFIRKTMLDVFTLHQKGKSLED